MNKPANILEILTVISTKISLISESSGKLVAWLVFLMTLLVGYDVTMRYLFQSGSVALQELEWHLFSLIFLLGAAYTLKHDEHVRLDLFYQSRFMNDYRRAWLNLFGSLFLLIPFSVLIIWSVWPFLEQAYIYSEGSPDPGGLPYRWLLKAVIPLGFALLVLQGISDALKNLARILGEKNT